MFIRRTYPGFTLIELLILLSVIVILTMTAAPSFISLIQNHRLRGTAESFYYAVQLARTEAVKRNANVYLSFTTGDTWCYGINVGSACNCATAGSCSLLTTSASAAQQISLSQTGYGGGSVFFEGAHGAANASGTITFTIYNQSDPLITAAISRLGNLTMCSTGISGYTAC